MPAFSHISVGCGAVLHFVGLSGGLGQQQHPALFFLFNTSETELQNLGFLPLWHDFISDFFLKWVESHVSL